MRKILVLLTFLVVLPNIVSANGGDQRIVENKYFISLSRAPFTPRVGVKTSFLASFVDIQKNKLIAEDLVVQIRITKQGDATKGIFGFKQNNILVHGGVLELPYTFTESGFHEIFFDFAFASNPQKVYEVPDFLLDVQEQSDGYNTNQVLLAVFGSFIIGLTVGWFVKRIR